MRETAPGNLGKQATIVFGSLQENNKKRICVIRKDTWPLPLPKNSETQISYKGILFT